MELPDKTHQLLQGIHVPSIQMPHRQAKMRQALRLVLENKRQTGNIGLNLNTMKLKFIAPVAIVALVAVVFVSGVIPGFGTVAPQVKAQAILNDAKVAVTQVSEDVRQDLQKLVQDDNLMRLLDEAYTSKSLEYVGAVTADVNINAQSNSNTLLKAVLREVDQVSDFSPTADYSQTLVSIKIDKGDLIDFSQARLLRYTNHDNLAVVLAINQDNLPIFKVILMQNKPANAL